MNSATRHLLDTALNAKQITGDLDVVPLGFTGTGHTFWVTSAMWRGFDMTGFVNSKVKLEL